MSLRRKRIYLLLSCLPLESLSSILNVGWITSLRNPQLNSIMDLDGTISLFSMFLLNLKCMAEILHSLGKRVDNITAWPFYTWLKVYSDSTSKVMVRYVPLIGSPSASTVSLCCFYSCTTFWNLKIFEYSTGKFSNGSQSQFFKDLIPLYF